MEKSVVSFFLAMISVVAFIGNTFVVILLIKKREWLRKVHSCLLLALAVQDILTAIGLFVLPGFVQPSNAYEVPRSPRLGQFYCSVIWSRYIPFALAISSVYTCLMLAIDRWFAVFRPMSYRRFSSSGKVITTMVTFPWIAGIAFEINTALNVGRMRQNDGSYSCYWRNNDASPKGIAIAIFTFVGMIILPAILMVIIYTQVVSKRREQEARILPRAVELRRNSIAPDRMQAYANSSLKRLTRIAFAASTVVVVCWLPDQFYFFLTQLGLVALRNELHDGLVILAFFNTCINPFLYGFTNKQYAQEFEIILCYRRGRGASVSQPRE